MSFFMKCSFYFFFHQCVHSLWSTPLPVLLSFCSPTFAPAASTVHVFEVFSNSASFREQPTPQCYRSGCVFHVINLRIQRWSKPTWMPLPLSHLSCWSLWSIWLMGMETQHCTTLSHTPTSLWLNCCWTQVSLVMDPVNFIYRISVQ